MKIDKSFYSIILILITNIGLSVLPHIILKSQWYIENPNLKYVTLFEALHTMIILPILMLYLNKKICKFCNINSIIMYGVIMVVSVYISNYFHFENFSVMTGRGENPDKGSELIKLVTLIIGVLIVVTGTYRRIRKIRKASF